jgi:cytoskeletal protein CcmA (bactofilin family)
MKTFARMREERGVALVTAIFVVFVVFMFGLAIIQMSIHSSTTSSYDRKRTGALGAAEAGIDYYLSALASSNASTIACGPIQKTLTDAGSSSFTVTATFYSSTGAVMTCPFGGSIPKAVLVHSVGISRTSTPGRIMETYVSLAAGAGVLGPGVLFSDANPKLSGSTVVNGNAGDDADLYTNGDLTTSSSAILHGSVYVQGEVTMNGGSQVSKDVWSNGSLTLQGSAIINGNVTSSTSSDTIKSGAHVYGNARAGTTITVDNNSILDGTRTPNAPQGPPPATTFPVFTYSASDWQTAGYTIQTYNNCNAAEAALNNLGTGNYVFRITNQCDLSPSGTVTLHGNVAIISDGSFSMSSGNGIQSDGTPHNLYLFFGLGSGSTCQIKISGFITGLVSLLYSHCKVTLTSSGFVMSGQVFAGTLETTGSATFTYLPVGVPGIAGGNFTENIVYLREVNR